MNELALNNLVTEIKFFENQAVTSYWEIGKRLSQAKEQVGYGNWDKWLSDNLNYSKSMADKLIRVSEEIKDSQSIAKLNFTQVLALTSVDEETRTKIIKNEHLEDKTVKETQEIIKKYKEEKAELEEENQGLKKANEELSRIAEREPQVIEKEVIREVKPDDYESLRLKAKELDKAYEEINRKDIQIKSLKLKEQEQLRKLNEIDGKGKIIDDLKMFMWKIDGFINDVGGLIYLTDYYDELPKEQKSYFEKSVQRISDWSNQLKYNLQNKKGDVMTTKIKSPWEDDRNELEVKKEENNQLDLFEKLIQKLDENKNEMVEQFRLVNQGNNERDNRINKLEVKVLQITENSPITHGDYQLMDNLRKRMMYEILDEYSESYYKGKKIFGFGLRIQSRKVRSRARLGAPMNQTLKRDYQDVMDAFESVNVTLEEIKAEIDDLINRQINAKELSA